MICDECNYTFEKNEGRYYHTGYFWLCDDCFEEKVDEQD